MMICPLVILKGEWVGGLMYKETYLVDICFKYNICIIFNNVTYGELVHMGTGVFYPITLLSHPYNYPPWAINKQLLKRIPKKTYRRQ